MGVYKQMGDTEINLSSPEQLSWLIYSRNQKIKKIGLKYLMLVLIKIQVKIKEDQTILDNSLEIQLQIIQK